MGRRQDVITVQSAAESGRFFNKERRQIYLIKSYILTSFMKHSFISLIKPKLFLNSLFNSF
jgi:hypothetical protein